jgi:hypothetical protein
MEELWSAFTALTSSGERFGCDIYARDARTLLETRFGDLVWLCRVLEAAYEAFSNGERASPFEYGEWRQNVARCVFLTLSISLRSNALRA